MDESTRNGASGPLVPTEPATPAMLDPTRIPRHARHRGAPRTSARLVWLLADLRRDLLVQQDALRTELADLRTTLAAPSLPPAAPLSSEEVATVVRRALHDQEAVLYHSLEGLTRQVMALQAALERPRRHWWQRGGRDQNRDRE